MNTRHYVRNMVLRASVAALLGTTSAAWAQTPQQSATALHTAALNNAPDSDMSPKATRVSVSFQRQVDEAGRVSYTNLSTASPSPSSRTPIVSLVSSLDVANALARNAVISSRPAQLIDAREATRRLGRAKLERDQGVRLLPGEQAQGGDALANASVASQRYQRRQDRLRQGVELAQRRSNETQR